MGMTRSWKAAIIGSILALLALGILVAVAGASLQDVISQSLLQLIIGTLLLIFGLQWLRKAILRASGLEAKHDEARAFRREQEAARLAGRDTRLGLDWFAFVVSFKGVFLEGMEVVFIVITFGLSAGLKNPHGMFVASMGALAAFMTVLIVGLIARGPLSLIPGNTLKFGVAVLLCTFGTFWSAEGVGFFSPSGNSLEWPGGDWALAGVLALWMVVSYFCVSMLQRLSAAHENAKYNKTGGQA